MKVNIAQPQTQLNSWFARLLWAENTIEILSFPLKIETRLNHNSVTSRTLLHPISSPTYDHSISLRKLPKKVADDVDSEAAHNWNRTMELHWGQRARVLQTESVMNKETSRKRTVPWPLHEHLCVTYFAFHYLCVERVDIQYAFPQQYSCHLRTEVCRKSSAMHLIGEFPQKQ